MRGLALLVFPEKICRPAVVLTRLSGCLVVWLSGCLVACGFAVTRCEPSVKCDDLVLALNESNNFSKFVQGMRLRFKEFAASH